jgi:two-component system alkaline phosphatase synthesis response regulator PhoP
MSYTIFVIDDEKDIQEILRVNFAGSYNTFTFSSAEEADLKLQENIIPDLIILDIMMEGIDGYEFCKYLSSSENYKKIPVIFLSAKTDEFDKILGLELGGDDYITKPFSMKELNARVKTVLRRSEKRNYTAIQPEDSDRKIITYRELTLSPEEFSLKLKDEHIKLTKTEFEILHLFLSNPNKVFSRNNIIDSVRGNDIYVVDRTIDVHIKNIRKKLREYKNILSTFSGVGYGFKKND